MFIQQYFCVKMELADALFPWAKLYVNCEKKPDLSKRYTNYKAIWVSRFAWCNYLYANQWHSGLH